MTLLDIQQLKIRLSKYTDIKAESPVGGIKTFCHNGVANTLQNTLRPEGKIICTTHGEGNLWQSKSQGILSETSRSLLCELHKSSPPRFCGDTEHGQFNELSYGSFLGKRIEAGNFVLL